MSTGVQPDDTCEAYEREAGVDDDLADGVHNEDDQG